MTKIKVYVRTTFGISNVDDPAVWEEIRSRAKDRLRAVEMRLRELAMEHAFGPKGKPEKKERIYSIGYHADRNEENELQDESQILWQILGDNEDKESDEPYRYFHQIQGRVRQLLRRLDKSDAALLVNKLQGEFRGDLFHRLDKTSVMLQVRLTASEAEKLLKLERGVGPGSKSAIITQMLQTGLESKTKVRRPQRDGNLTEKVSFRCPSLLGVDLRKRSTQEGMDRSKLIRSLIVRGLKGKYKHKASRAEWQDVD